MTNSDDEDNPDNESERSDENVDGSVGIGEDDHDEDVDICEAEHDEEPDVSDEKNDDIDGRLCDGKKCHECGGKKVRDMMLKLKVTFENGLIGKRNLVGSAYCHCLAWPKEVLSSDESDHASSDESECVMVGAQGMNNPRVLCDSDSD